MKKIIIVQNIRSLLAKEDSFLNRSDIRIYPVASNEEGLDIHRNEKASLIISDFDTTAMNSETFCSIIREDEELCRVSIIVVCPESADPRKIIRCRANAFVRKNVPVILNKAQQLLDVSRREAYRAPISIKVEGKYDNKPFLCYSENISVSGMLFETDRILSEGDEMQCSFMLPDSTLIAADAKIIRMVKIPEFEINQYGIRFTDMIPKAKAAIEVYVERISRKKQP